ALGSGLGVISGDGRWLARADESGTVRLETLEDGKELGVLAPPQPLNYWGLALTRDGSRLIGARAYPNACIDVWDLRLIGERLRQRGLGQDWPRIAPAGPPGKSPLKVTVETGPPPQPEPR